MIQNMAPPAKRWKCWLHGILQKNSHKLGRHQVFLLKHWPHLCLSALVFSCSSIPLSSAFTCHPPNLILPPFKMYFMKLIFKAPRCSICCVSLSAVLSFHFSFCFFKAAEENLTFTVQHLLSQMREEKSRSASFFPSKYLMSVLVLRGVWTNRHEICSNVFFLDWSYFSVIVHGFHSPNSTTTHFWLKVTVLCLRFQWDLMNKKISLLKHPWISGYWMG